MPDFFPPDDFDGEDFPEELRRAGFSPEDFYLESLDEFLARGLLSPDEELDAGWYGEDDLSLLAELGFAISEEDEVHGDLFSQPTVAVLSLQNVDPRDLRRHIFPSTQDVLNWLNETGLINIGSIVDLGGGLYGVAIEATSPRGSRRTR